MEKYKQKLAKIGEKLAKKQQKIRKIMRKKPEKTSDGLQSNLNTLKNLRKLEK